MDCSSTLYHVFQHEFCSVLLWWLCGVDASRWHVAGEGSAQGLPGRGEVDVIGPPMVVTYRLQVIPPSYCVKILQYVVGAYAVTGCTKAILQPLQFQHVVGQYCQRHSCLGRTDSACAGLLDRPCEAA